MFLLSGLFLLYFLRYSFSFDFGFSKCPPGHFLFYIQFDSGNRFPICNWLRIQSIKNCLFSGVLCVIFDKKIKGFWFLSRYSSMGYLVIFMMFFRLLILGKIGEINIIALIKFLRSYFGVYIIFLVILSS